MKSFLSFFSSKGKIYKENLVVFGLIFLFVIGLFIGTAVIGTSANNKECELFNFFVSLFEGDKSIGIFKGILSVFISNLLFLFVSYFLGLSAFGNIFIFVLPFFLGLQKGLNLSFMHISGGLAVFLKSFCFFIIHNSILLLLFIYVFGYSIKMSSQTFYTVRGISRFDVEYIAFYKYNKNYLFFSFGILILSITDVLLSNLT